MTTRSSSFEKSATINIMAPKPATPTLLFRRLRVLLPRLRDAASAGSALAVALSIGFAHGVADNAGQGLGQAVNLALQFIKPLVHLVEPFVDFLEPLLGFRLKLQQ